MRQSLVHSVAIEVEELQSGSLFSVVRVGQGSRRKEVLRLTAGVFSPVKLLDLGLSVRVNPGERFLV